MDSQYSQSHYDTNPRPTKRRRRELVPEAPRDSDSAAVVPEEVVSQLLHVSTAQILQSIGYSSSTALAQERMRQLASNYYLSLLKSISRFAAAQRRTKPTVIDFEDTLKQHDISLSALEDEMRRMPSKPPAALQTQTANLPPEPDLSALLGPELDGSRDTRCRIYDHLPPFPSRHTYQQTPVFSERPTDPRMIREKATAEARLAEAALRKLLAVSAAPPRKEAAAQVGRKRKQRHEEWKKAFEGLSGDDGFGRGSNINNNGVESLSSIMNDPIPIASAASANKAKENEAYLEVVVNADSQFWRKGTGNAKRAQTA